MKTIFDVSHVLTQGIIEREVIYEGNDSFITVRIVGGTDNRKYLQKGEWAEDLEVAKELATYEKINKRRLLKAQIEKLEKGDIKVIMLEDKR